VNHIWSNGNHFSRGILVGNKAVFTPGQALDPCSAASRGVLTALLSAGRFSFIIFESDLVGGLYFLKFINPSTAQRSLGNENTFHFTRSLDNQL